MKYDLRAMDAMTTKLVTVSPKETVLSAVKKMIDAGVGNILVVDKDGLVGIVTEKDIISKIVAINQRPEKVLVSKVMTRKVVTSTPNTSLQSIAREMIKSNIRRMPIIKSKKLVGIVTDKDLLRIAPGLLDVLVEKLKIERESISESAGFCENCNAYSRSLVRKEGNLLCPNCTKL